MSVRSGAERAARAAILRAAGSDRLGAVVSRYGMRLGARRFVPAENLDEIVAVMRELNRAGMRGVTASSTSTPARSSTSPATRPSTAARSTASRPRGSTPTWR